LVCGFGGSVFAKSVSQQEWQCNVDLHQGDRGVLFLIRAGSKISGGIKIASNTAPMNHRITGSWVGSSLKLKRLLSNDVDYAMVAIMQRTDKKIVQLGGRYGLNYKGVWSGECRFISEKKIQVTDPVRNTEPKPDRPITNAGPSTNVKALPYKPTTKDRIKFSATASHPDGVRSISFVLDGRVIKTCRRSRCNATSPPLSPGKHIWRVDAVSKSGYRNPKYTSELIVKMASQLKGQCTIKGKATGRSSDIARIFSVSAYGPNNDRLFVKSSRFKDGRFELKNLQPGNYKLFVDTRADTPIGAHPSQATVRCRRSNGAVRVHKDFEFR
ncbi:MAG: hypothetical protein JKX81_02810, partial [Arenicella sp.]|nr:hypothetical protein [Arenicella sp.]